MTGARLSKAQVEALHESPEHMLIIAAAADKFGDMGDVCAASVSVDGGTARIDHFVLSCRVFGYGVETALIDCLSERPRSRGDIASLVGIFRPTTQNQVSRNMYADHGFMPGGEGGAFTLPLD